MPKQTKVWTLSTPPLAGQTARPGSRAVKEETLPRKLRTKMNKVMLPASAAHEQV